MYVFRKIEKIKSIESTYCASGTLDSICVVNLYNETNFYEFDYLCVLLVCVFVCVCVCVFVCMYVSVCVCMLVCVYVCLVPSSG